MTTFIRLLPVVIAVLGASMPAVIEAQTPLPPVKLMRPAASRMLITLALSDSTVSEGEILYGDCVAMPTQIYVEPNAYRGNFTINTLAPAARRPSTQYGSSKTFTITASYGSGSDRISTTFTVTRLCTGLWG